jgi:hypothetical protein
MLTANAKALSAAAIIAMIADAISNSTSVKPQRRAFVEATWLEA